MRNSFIERLYDKDNYFVLKDHLGNVFAYKENGDKGTQEYYAENINVGDLPNKVKEKVSKELI